MGFLGHCRVSRDVPGVPPGGAVGLAVEIERFLISKVTDRGERCGNSLKIGEQCGGKVGVAGAHRSLFVLYKPLWGEFHAVPTGLVSGPERDVPFSAPAHLPSVVLCLSSPSFWGLLEVGAWF